MARVQAFICFLAAFPVQTLCFGNVLGTFLNIRCNYADSFLKDAFRFYDELIATRIVSFYYQPNNGEAFEISRNVNDSYQIESFDYSKPTRVIIHGFWNSHNSRINKALRKVYTENFDYNLIVVSYSRVSRDVCYRIARSRVGILARRIAFFLDAVLGSNDWQWKNLIVIGHSLGAHTAGVVGRTVKKGRIGAIFALDPAKPGFESATAENRLRSDDADHVECIHSNGNTLGLFDSLCQLDFYPNFGKEQPGCTWTRDLCSHSRAWKYYVESLTSNFTANQCDSMDEILNETKCNGTEILMGGEHIEAKRNITGIFELSTNEDPPYSRG